MTVPWRGGSERGSGGRHSVHYGVAMRRWRGGERAVVCVGVNHNVAEDRSGWCAALRALRRGRGRRCGCWRSQRSRGAQTRYLRRATYGVASLLLLLLLLLTRRVRARGTVKGGRQHGQQRRPVGCRVRLQRCVGVGAAYSEALRGGGNNQPTAGGSGGKEGGGDDVRLCGLVRPDRLRRLAHRRPRRCGSIQVQKRKKKVRQTKKKHNYPLIRESLLLLISSPLIFFFERHCYSRRKGVEW